MTMAATLFLLLFSMSLVATTQALHLNLPKGICAREIEALSRRQKEDLIDDGSGDKMRLAVCLHLNEHTGWVLKQKASLASRFC